MKEPRQPIALMIPGSVPVLLPAVGGEPDPESCRSPPIPLPLSVNKSSFLSLVAEAGDAAAKRFANFFGSIPNDNNRAAYQRACHCFFNWCDGVLIRELAEIEPIHVGAYLKDIGGRFEKPTIKQHLAAIRMLFDYLVTGQIVAINPAHAMHAPKHVIKCGKTPVLTAAAAASCSIASIRRP